MESESEDEQPEELTNRHRNVEPTIIEPDDNANDATDQMPTEVVTQTRTIHNYGNGNDPIFDADTIELSDDGNNDQVSSVSVDNVAPAVDCEVNLHSSPAKRKRKRLVLL